MLKRLNGVNLILMELERSHVPLGYSLCILVKEREIIEYTKEETQGAKSVGSYFTPKFNHFYSFVTVNVCCVLIDPVLHALHLFSKFTTGVLIRS